jgi:hypothetical protein
MTEQELAPRSGTHVGPAPIDSRDRAATGDVPNDVCGENYGEGRIIPPSTRIVLMSQQSLVRMHGLGRPAR